MFVSDTPMTHAVSRRIALVLRALVATYLRLSGCQLSAIAVTAVKSEYQNGRCNQQEVETRERRLRCSKALDINVPKARLQTALRGLVLPLALASCSNVQPYPDDWGALEERGAPGQCPLLSGIYAEWGQAPEGCHAWVEQCRSLSWNLLSGHMSYGEFMDESTTPDSPHGSHVELRQGGDDRLEVLLWDIRGEESRVVREETLSARKDFSCDADGLTLSPRSLVVVFGISNVAASYTRTLSLSDDNHLVLNSSEAIVGHHTFFPILVSNTIWVRWPPLQ